MGSFLLQKMESWDSSTRGDNYDCEIDCDYEYKEDSDYQLSTLTVTFMTMMSTWGFSTKVKNLSDSSLPDFHQ